MVVLINLEIAYNLFIRLALIMQRLYLHLNLYNLKNKTIP